MIRALLRRCVVNDNGRAFGRKLFGNASANAFRGARNHRYFSHESLAFHFFVLSFLS